MDAYDELIDELLGTALAPQEMRDLALMQVKDASVQDDAVKDAIRNHQGYEQSQRSALDEYLIAQEQQAKAEAQRAAEMAQQRLNALDNIDSLILTTVGIGKEGKLRLAQNEAERQDIIRAFPQFGARARKEGEGKDKPKELDLKAMLANKDYSPENIDLLFAENDADLWADAIRSGDLDLYQAMYDRKLGQIPESMEAQMRYKISGMPELSKELARNEKYKMLRPLLNGGTFGDEKKKARDEANAKIQSDIRKATDIARALLSDNATGEEWDKLKEDEKENFKRHINDIPADIRSNAIGFMRAMNLIP